MPKNEFILLKHAKTKIDSSVPVSKWNLDPEGLSKLHSLSKRPEFSNIDIIISSSEYKAKKTAKVINQKLKLEMSSYKELNELNRDEGDFLTSIGYNESVKWTFENPKKSINNWETADNALVRFSKCIKSINKKYHEKCILILSHGIIINLYLATIRGDQKNIYKYWLNMDFCDYAIIKNSTIIKDIAIKETD